MNLYRSLLWWLALAALGALGWTWFSQDLGDVVVRFRGYTYTTTLAYVVLAWALLWFSLWALWWLLSLPLVAWRRHARQQARNRLVSGLDALHQGRWPRADTLLTKAADEPALRTAALLGARQAAAASGNVEIAARHQAALLSHDPAAAALDQAARLGMQGRHADVLVALATLSGDLPPRGQHLQALALCALGRAQEALALLTPLRRDQALAPDALAILEIDLVAASLAQAPQADALLQRWAAQPRRLQLDAPVVAAFASRAVGLGLQQQGVDALGDAIEAQWSETLAAQFGRLSASRDVARLARAETWMPAHASSPALLVSLGQLCFQQQLWGKAEDYLHRALAQGAGADAWEALGQVWTARNEDGRAALAYANALRLARGEPALGLGGRSLREQIADQAVAEQRNAHGIPQLPAEK